jgi:hypothetical protein
VLNFLNRNEEEKEKEKERKGECMKDERIDRRMNLIKEKDERLNDREKEKIDGRLKETKKEI